jgi:hypothetical protein
MQIKHDVIAAIGGTPLIELPNLRPAGGALNDHVYTGPLHEGQTVFKYKPLPKGTMAAKLEQPVYSPPKQEPTGRTRTSDFFEAEVPLYQ